MNLFDVATVFTVVITILLVWRLWDRWFSFSARWDLWTPTGERPKLDPESQFVVSISEENMSCTPPDGAVETINKSDLTRVEIATTDEGPFVPDIFWLLHAEEGGVLIPWGATGEKELLEYLQSLPNFQNEVIVEAASLTTNQLLPCWERRRRT